MTEAAIKMQNTNTTIVKGTISYPLSASEAFKLGIGVRTAIMNVYASLAEKCSTNNDRAVINNVVTQDQEKSLLWRKNLTLP